MQPANPHENLHLPLTVDQSFSRIFSLNEESIRQFASLVGDPNPLHYDKEIAKKSRFGGLIASGTQISSVLGAMIASSLCNLRPSLGLEISFNFRRPVYPNVKMIAKWRITSIDPNARLGGDIVTFSGELLTFSNDEVLVIGKVVSLVT